MTPDYSPDLKDVIEERIQTALSNLRVAQPGRVESYDVSKATVEVTPLLRVPQPQSDGTIKWISLSRLPSIPLLFPLRAGGRRATMPVKVGDIVLLIWCDFNLDDWKSGAGVNDPAGVVTPRYFAGHALPDAIAIPGLFDPVTNAPPTDDISIAADGTITLAGGNKNVARATDPVSAATTMSTWISAVHALLNGSGAAVKGPLVLPSDFGVIGGGNPKIKG